MVDLGLYVPDAIEGRMTMAAQSQLACAKSALSDAAGKLFSALCCAQLLSLSSGRRRFVMVNNRDAISVRVL